jgi:Protein of unknown function (DUF1592)/Protein of unknown function (DUF1588)/Protein of unknown function (DUF1595)/Protein of unknown function (DUF1587)
MRSLLRALSVCCALGGASCAAPGALGLSEPHVSLAEGAKLLPARTRRLTNFELDNSLSHLTGLNVALAPQLPPDVRQEGYTPNANQDVSSAWATRYSALVTELSTRAATRLARAGGCHDLGVACRTERTRELGRMAFRRPLTADEQRALIELLGEAAESGESFEGALGLLLQTLAESPSFLYVTELGGVGVPRQPVRLDDAELASELAFMLTAAPPDAQLLDAAQNGQLRTPHGRSQQALRLLGIPSTRYQFRRFTLEWLEVDGLLDTAKSSQLFPSYDALKPFMLGETENYVDEVMVNGGASVQSLLAGGFASVGPEMAHFYGLNSYGPRASLRGTGRLGVLQQASFLAAHAHEDVTSPVKRGDFVMRKLLCEKLKRPAEIGLEVVMPPPSATLSNRERLSQHIADPGCASCHTTLDALGFTFEDFDAMGAAQTTDHGKPVDAHVDAHLGQSAKQSLALDSSAALTQALLENPTISECFARHAFRYFSAQSDPAVEASFLGLRAQLPAAERDNLFQVLLAYVASDLFTLRENGGG